MRANTLLTVGLAVAAVLVADGCKGSREGGPNQNIVAPERSEGSRGGDSMAQERSEGSRGGDSVARERSEGVRGGYSGAPGLAREPDRPLTLGSSGQITLLEGTPLVVRTTSALSSNSQVSGQAFTAHLDQPLVANGREIFGRGTEVEGRIMATDKGGRVKGRATISVQMTRLHPASGRPIDISTSTITQGAHATKQKDALKIGIGSGVGAAIGAIAGGGKGAAIGAAAGAGAGTGAVLATHGDSAVIPSESVLRFTLRAPASIASMR